MVIVEMMWWASLTAVAAPTGASQEEAWGLLCGGVGAKIAFGIPISHTTLHDGVELGESQLFAVCVAAAMRGGAFLPLTVEWPLLLCGRPASRF